MTTQSTDSSATTDEHRNRNAERAQLHSTIWRIANDLRGSVDGWDFKQYVLGMLFYRYLSESQVRFVEAQRIEMPGRFEDLSDDVFKENEDAKDYFINERGFLLLPSQLFSNVYKNASQNQNLNETLANVFKAFEESARGTDSEANVKGLFDDFVLDSNKLGVSPAARHENLLKLMDAVAGMNLEKGYEDSENDAFGDAYEYLMGMYAANAGKSGGEYYTPQEGSELLAEIVVGAVPISRENHQGGLTFEVCRTKHLLGERGNREIGKGASDRRAHLWAQTSINGCQLLVVGLVLLEQIEKRDVEPDEGHEQREGAVPFVVFRQAFLHATVDQLVVHEEVHHLIARWKGAEPLGEFFGCERPSVPPSIGEPEGDIVRELVVFQ